MFDVWDLIALVRASKGGGGRSPRADFVGTFNLAAVANNTMSWPCTAEAAE